MFEFLQSIFRQTPETAGGYDEKLVSLAIERVVDGTDTRLRGMPGYRNKLQPAVINALEYTIELSRTLPRPILFSVDQFRHNEQIRAFFASPERIETFMLQSRALQAYMKRHTPVAPEQIYALLTLTRKERNVLGMEMVGEVFRRDVAQVSVSFANPMLSAVKGKEAKSRFEMKKDVFDYFIELALRDIADARCKQQEERRQRDLLARKRETLIAGDLGMCSLFSGEENKTVDLESARVELDRLEAELQQREIVPFTLDEHLESIIDSLGSAHERLWHESVEVRLNRMGIKAEQDDSSALTLRLDEYCNAAGERIIGIPVQIPFDAVPVRESPLAELDRYLS